MIIIIFIELLLNMFAKKSNIQKMFIICNHDNEHRILKMQSIWNMIEKNTLLCLQKQVATL